MDKNLSIKILLNWDNKQDEFFLVKELKKLGNYVNQYSLTGFNPVNYKNIGGKTILFLYYIKGAFLACKELKQSEILIGTNFHVGMIASIICRILKKKNEIIALNIIINKKKGIISKLRTFAYWLSFRNKHFYCTINSEHLLSDYNNLLNIKLPVNRIYVLKDHYLRKHESVKVEVDKDNKYIFTGGENARDWSTLFNAAEILREINFICIARKRFFPNIKIPPNVKMIYDVDYDLFLDYLKRCSIVVLPINSEGPAGLLVLFDATFLKKSVIMTETKITKNYIINGESGLLVKMHDHLDLVRSIKLLYGNDEMKNKFSTNMHNKLEKDYSSKHFAEEISRIIDSIISINK